MQYFIYSYILYILLCISIDPSGEGHGRVLHTVTVEIAELPSFCMDSPAFGRLGLSLGSMYLD